MPQGIAPLTPEELALFNEFLSSRFGLVFPEHKREILESRLEPRLRANRVHRFIDYYLLLQYDLDRELDPMTRAVTNNESYFFRETAQLEALAENLEELRAGGTSGQLRILSAGCSSGEEPYSLNIIVRDRALGLDPDKLRIDGIDIDTERLEMARRGIYRPISLRALTEGQIIRFFKRLDRESFELKPGFRQGVEFYSGNIFDLATFPRGADRDTFDAIFCRNVLIYFSEAALKSTVENFARVLRPGGLLFLGHSESIIGLSQAFQVERLGQCIAYRRAEG